VLGGAGISRALRWYCIGIALESRLNRLRAPSRYRCRLAARGPPGSTPGVGALRKSVKIR